MLKCIYNCTIHFVMYSFICTFAKNIIMRNYLTWKEANMLQSQFMMEKKYDLSLLFYLSLHTGLRISDLLSLRWVDLINKSTIELIECKSKKKKVIELSEDTKSYIENIYILKKPNSCCNFCFVSQKKVIYSIQRINQILKATAIKCKISDVKLSTNSLRITFGREVYFRSNGEALNSLSIYFSHPSDQFTLSYLHLKKDENLYFHSL